MPSGRADIGLSQAVEHSTFSPWEFAHGTVSQTSLSLWDVRLQAMRELWADSRDAELLQHGCIQLVNPKRKPSLVAQQKPPAGYPPEVRFTKFAQQRRYFERRFLGSSLEASFAFARKSTCSAMISQP